MPRAAASTRYLRRLLSEYRDHARRQVWVPLLVSIAVATASIPYLLGAVPEGVHVAWMWARHVRHIKCTKTAKVISQIFHAGRWARLGNYLTL